MAAVATESIRGSGGRRPGGGRTRRPRRRRQDKPAASAQLLLDERVRGEGGFVAEDLWADLFPQFRGKLPCADYRPEPPVLRAWEARPAR
jgi:hypothetical protein